MHTDTYDPELHSSLPRSLEEWRSHGWSPRLSGRFGLYTTVGSAIPESAALPVGIGKDGLVCLSPCVYVWVRGFSGFKV